MIKLTPPVSMPLKKSKVGIFGFGESHIRG
jgi:hypothetical protein